MSTITNTPTAAPTRESLVGDTAREHPVRRATLSSGAVAAVAVTALAGVADAAGVPLAVDGSAIPLLGFAQMTLVGAVLGGLLAAGLNRYAPRARQWFLVTTIALTILSCVPSVILPPDLASMAVLVATHLVAAAIIVPVLARRTHR